MTDREVMQQALEALEYASTGNRRPEIIGPAITALNEALAREHAMHDLARLGQEIEQAETPPEWPLVKNILDEYGLDAIAFVAEWKAAQRPWVGLTDEDWKWVADKKETSLDTFAHGAAWAADQLKERNT